MKRSDHNKIGLSFECINFFNTQPVEECTKCHHVFCNGCVKNGHVFKCNHCNAMCCRGYGSSMYGKCSMCGSFCCEQGISSCAQQDIYSAYLALNKNIFFVLINIMLVNYKKPQIFARYARKN